MAAALLERDQRAAAARQVRRLTITVAGSGGAVMHHHFTFRPSAAGMAEERLIRGLHPYIAQRMQLERLRKFDLTRLPSSDEEVYLFRASRGTTRPTTGWSPSPGPRPDRAARARRQAGALPTAEDTIAACLDSIRRAQSRRPARTASTPTGSSSTSGRRAADPRRPGDARQRCCPPPRAPGWRRSLFIGRQRNPETGALTKAPCASCSTRPAAAELTVGEPSTEPIEPLDDYRQKVLRASSRNTVYPYELTGLLGEFTEHDLDADGRAGAGRPAEGAQHRGDRRRRGLHPDAAAPRGRHPGGAAGRPDEGARRAVGAGVPPGHRRAGPGRADAGAAGVVRAVGRRPDLDGLGTENMDWVARRCADRRVHPGRRRDQRRGRRASTSARSRTGTPRPRCSCTPRASW
jgi:hypothetical protein